MSSDSIGSKTFDVSPKEREVIEWKAQKRLELRKQYLNEIHNPNKGGEGHIFDPQIQRQYTAYFAYERIWNPRVKSFLWFAGLIFGSWSAGYYYIKKHRDIAENKFRTGQVSYRDRDGKFV